MRSRPSTDRRPRPLSQRPRVRLAAFTLTFGLAVSLAAEAAIGGPFDGGMPLVLKDGRIATVRIHEVPFATGTHALDGATAATLQAVFEPLATDCFLTAQAIGHVAPGITRDGDTLAAHRLARARADAIQAALVGFGMPQASVASVWDWQFLLAESRATVWVFSLTRGDDCEGTPLPKGEPAVAAVEDPAVGASPQAVPTRRSTDAAVETVVVTAQPPAEELPPAAPVVLSMAAPVSAALQTGEAPTAVVAQPVARDPLATAAVGPVQPTTGTAPAAKAVATPAPATRVAAIDPDRARHTGAAGAPALAISFAQNSSYFPAGATRELRDFLDGLPSAEPIEIEVAGAVGTSGVRGASDEEAQRYNAWMAERRIERVTEWLQQNAGDRQLTLAETLVENDASRQVRLRASVVSQ